MKEKLLLAERLFEVMPSVIQKIRSEARTKLPNDVSLSHVRILARLARGLNQIKQLAEDLELSQPGISKMVDDLVEKGLISRKVHPDDRRAQVLTLTQKGQDYFERVRDATCTSLNAQLSHLSADDKQELLNALEVIERCFKGPALTGQLLKA